jgi:hypothetical protein
MKARGYAAVAAALVATALAATAGTAHAGMSLSLGQPDLQAGVLVAVPATVSCSPWDASLTPASSSISVNVEQAVGKSAIAHGSAELFGGEGSELLFPCDDSPHTFTLNVLADPSGAPFRKGQAVLTGFAGAAAGTSCGPGCIFGFVFQNTSLTSTAKLK